MIVFGIQSSLFDFITFVVLRYAFHSDAQTFRTGWFLESLLTQLLILLVIRTQRPFFKSKPSPYLLTSVGIILICAIGLPYSFLGARFQFHPLTGAVLASIILIALFYISVAELSKRFLVNNLAVHVAA
jgi:Cation transport ATPase